MGRKKAKLAPQKKPRATLWEEETKEENNLPSAVQFLRDIASGKAKSSTSVEVFGKFSEETRTEVFRLCTEAVSNFKDNDLDPAVTIKFFTRRPGRLNWKDSDGKRISYQPPDEANDRLRLCGKLRAQLSTVNNCACFRIIDS